MPIGPLLPAEHHLRVEDRHPAEKWLDNQKEDSVLYVAFGSGVVFSPAQILELTEGLESSGQPFVLVLQLPNGEALDKLSPGIIVFDEYRLLNIQSIVFSSISGPRLPCCWHNYIETSVGARAVVTSYHWQLQVTGRVRHYITDVNFFSGYQLFSMEQARILPILKKQSRLGHLFKRNVHCLGEELGQIYYGFHAQVLNDAQVSKSAPKIVVLLSLIGHRKCAF